MKHAYDIIEKFSAGIDDEIEQFACNTISEMGGFPIGYEEVLVLLRENPSEQGVLNYMNS